MLRAMNQDVPHEKRTLEINAAHPLVAKMKGLSGDELKDAVELLYDQALIAEGSAIPDPARFTKLLTQLLAQDVTAALANEAVPLAAAAVKELVTGSAAAEVATAPKFVDALRAQLAAQAQDGVKVVADEMTGAGFTVKLDNGRVEHDFTDAAISGALAQRLRSDLAALIK